MTRMFKVNRRRPHIVDLFTPNVVGVDGYRIKWATNFDGLFADTVLTSTNMGYMDPAINRAVIEAQPTGGQVRIVFDPASAEDNGPIDDTLPFWIKVVHVVGGVEQTPSAATLLLPDSARHGVGIISIAGNAPNEASSADSLQIDLPMLMQDFRFHNSDGANSLFVATQAGGPEQEIPANLAMQTLGILGTQSTLFVRGGGGVVPFSATFTLAFPR